MQLIESRHIEIGLKMKYSDTKSHVQYEQNTKHIRVTHHG